MDAPQKIAVIRPDNLGDHVLGSGLLHALAQTYKSASITVFVPQQLEALYRYCPNATARSSSYGLAGRYDWLVFPRHAHDHYKSLFRYAHLLSPTGRRFGFDTTMAAHDSGLIEAEADRHLTYYAHRMAQALGCKADAMPRAWWVADDWEVLRLNGLEERRYVVVGLGASFPFKRPTLEVYRYLVAALHERGHAVVLTGLSDQGKLADDLSPGRALNLVGKIGLPFLAALLARARLYIGPDAGPKHIAAAAGTPVIELAWVPADYPVTARGDLTGGVCWRPWGVPFALIEPDSTAFWPRFRTEEFFHSEITGVKLDSIDFALSRML